MQKSRKEESRQEEKYKSRNVEIKKSKKVKK